MKQFILLYRGNATDPSEMDPEDRDAIMKKWQEWMDAVGDGLVDVGAPMMPDGESVVDDGSEGDVEPLNGYSIVQAADMSAARALVDGHPFLSDGNGDFSVNIYELLPVPV
jgi:hypothetical protein